MHRHLVAVPFPLLAEALLCLLVDEQVVRVYASTQQAYVVATLLFGARPAARVNVLELRVVREGPGKKTQL